MRLIGDFEGFRTAREEKIKYLERVPIFEACSLRQLRAVADIAKVVEVPERTILTRQGEPGAGRPTKRERRDIERLRGR